MKKITSLYVAILWFCGTVWTQSQDNAFTQLLSECLPNMGAERIPDRAESQQKLQEALWMMGAPGREAELREACQSMAARLGPATPRPARVWLLQQLNREGHDECTEALAACLGDADAEIRECARRALMNNPDPTANTVLISQLQKTRSDAERVALCLALGYRSDPASVKPLAALQTAENDAVAIASIRALGHIANDAAAEALSAAHANAQGERRRRISDAWLTCARRMAAGNAAAAASIYAHLDSAAEGQAVRLAAMQGRLATAGRGVASLVVQWLRGADGFARNLAAGHVQDIRDKDVLAELMKSASALPPLGHVLLLHGFAANGDRTLAPAAVAGMVNADADVRRAAADCLAIIGDASAVPVLLDRALGSEGDSVVARDALRQIHGKGVDALIISAMGKEVDAARKTVLIGILADREAREAVPALVEELRSVNPQLRAAALDALGLLGSAEQVPMMLAVYVALEDRHQQGNGEKAILAACGRTAEGCDPAAPVLAALSKSSPREQARLLPLVGRIGGEETRKAVVAALQQENPAVRKAAVAALSNWPDDGVLPILSDIARGDERPENRVEALRGFIRVVAADADRRSDETLELLEQAMQVAERDDERKLVLKRLVMVRDVKALRFAAPYLDRAALANEAGRTIVYLASQGEVRKKSYAEEVKTVLGKVIAVSKDTWLTNEANKQLKGL